MLISLLVTSCLASGDPLEKTGAHFRVISALPQPAVAEQALAAAEAAWPLALEALGLPDAKLETPLTIHLYADVPSYEQAEQGLTGGAFQKNLVFSHFETKSSHLVLQPPASPEALAELGLPTLSAYLIAHEAAHLVSYAFVPNSLDQPDWFAEGMAQHVAEEALLALHRARADGAEPLTCKSAVRGQALLAAKKLPDPAAILEAKLDGLEFYER